MAHVLVLGGGESGRGVALLAQAKHHTAFVSDAGALSPAGRDELVGAGVDFEEGGHGADVLRGVDLVVKSPGIPWTAPLVVKAQQHTIPVIGEMEFCAPYVEGRVIGITGSNGKTTTTLLVGQLLASAGVDHAIGGNVGTSFARLLLARPRDYYVLELSSFQLEDIRDFHVDIGAVLNLSPDHLDRYAEGFRGYAAAKYQLKRTLRPGATWLQATDAVSREHAPGIPAGAVQVDMPAAYRAGEAVTPNRTYDLTETTLAGPHNAANASFALAIAELTGATTAQLQTGLRAFRNAPHRLETVGFAGGVRYVNDSKATNTDAVDKAVDSFDAPLVLILGGEDKGNDYRPLKLKLRGRRVRALVAMGADNAKILGQFAGEDYPVHDCGSLANTLEICAMEAQPGDVVLLAPACASFDLFESYIDRGDRFRRGVRALPDFRETL